MLQMWDMLIIFAKTGYLVKYLSVLISKQFSDFVEALHLVIKALI